MLIGVLGSNEIEELCSSEDMPSNGAQCWQETHFLLVGFQKVAPGWDQARN